MKFNLVRTIELSVLVVLLLASVGAVSSVSFSSATPATHETHEADPFGVSAAREWQSRVIDYLNSPTINPK